MIPIFGSNWSFRSYLKLDFMNIRFIETFSVHDLVSKCAIYKIKIRQYLP